MAAYDPAGGCGFVCPRRRLRRHGAGAWGTIELERPFGRRSQWGASVAYGSRDGSEASGIGVPPAKRFTLSQTEEGRRLIPIIRSQRAWPKRRQPSQATSRLALRHRRTLDELSQCSGFRIARARESSASNAGAEPRPDRVGASCLSRDGLPPDAGLRTGSIRQSGPDGATMKPGSIFGAVSRLGRARGNSAPCRPVGLRLGMIFAGPSEANELLGSGSCPRGRIAGGTDPNRWPLRRSFMGNRP